MVSVFFILNGFKAYKFIKENVKKIPKATFEQQLDSFQKLGFKFNNGITKESLLDSFDKSEFENDPWNLMYVCLGSTIEKEPYTPITDDCWHFDAECIEDHGSYVDILENLKRISKGQLNLENIKDYVDIENEKAWVSFDFEGKSYKWNLRIDNDWVDGELFDKIQEVNSVNKNTKKFTVYVLGQDAVIGYMNDKEISEFKKTTKIELKYLEGINDIGQ